LHVHSESLRIADQLRRTLTGDPWHGTPCRGLLDGVTVEQALARPLPEAHNIWELVLHMNAWTSAACDAAMGAPMPKLFHTPQDWPAPADSNRATWQGAVGNFFLVGERMAAAIAEFPDARLMETVPGRKYDFYFLFHGIVQHIIYHSGQIAVLRKGL
jgi:DinB superfamily